MIRHRLPGLGLAAVLNPPLLKKCLQQARAFIGRHAALLSAVSDRATLRDLRTHEADLEEIFLAYYKDAR